MQKPLQLLVDLLPEVKVIGSADRTVTDITADSRVVQQGSLFIALKGAHVDGHDFIPKAVEQGAAAILTTRDIEPPVRDGEAIPVLRVPELLPALDTIVPAFHDFPAQSMRIVLQGDVPQPIDPPPGCPFASRCRYVKPICREQLPEMRAQGFWRALRVQALQSDFLREMQR